MNPSRFPNAPLERLPHGSGDAADWLLASLARFNQYVSSAEELGNRKGLLQAVDPRIKLVGILSLVVSVVVSRQLAAILFVFLIGLILAVLSKVRLQALLIMVWSPVLLFTGAIALPALFLTSGRTLFVLPIPGWHITAQGLRAASYLVSRAETAATLSALLALTTPWAYLLKALRVFCVPVVFIVILSATYRYMFVLLQTAADMSESRKSRTVGRLDSKESRRIAAATIGVLLSKSFEISNDVHLAMLSRGFRGDLYTLHNFRAFPRDWLWLGVVFAFSALTIYAGH
ncbi:MAG TPA: cobalt ECF transporter T component CbiQ [Terriglobia bacterium]|jgi:cobalt ECF transporter T component CbiQ